jgi:hypothetical protein
MILKATAAATILSVYAFTMFFIAAIPENVVQTATQLVDTTVVK